MSSWTEEQMRLHEERTVWGQTMEEAKFLLCARIRHEIEQLHECDIQGHIWWNKFLLFVDPTANDPVDETKYDLPF